MAMTLTANGGPEGYKAGVVPGRWMPRQSLAGVNVDGVSNMIWKAVCVDLELTAYVTGGVPFVMTDIGMNSIHDMYVYGSVDPFNQGTVVGDMPDGVGFHLDKTTPSTPKLVLRDSGGEVSNATVYSGKAVWLLVGGT